MRIAVITGASYGLGKSIAETLLLGGYKVYGMSRTQPKIVNENFVWIKADLYSEQDIKSAKIVVVEDKIDVLVNNAGTHIEQAALDFTTEVFHKVFDLNFLAPIYLTKSLSDKLDNSIVINISSTSDRFVENNSGLYSASKASLQMFFEVMALENKNIKIVNILPSYVNTPLQHKISDGRDFDWSLCVAPEEISKFILELIDGKFDIPSGGRVMVLNNKTMDDTEDPENLYYYNVDTKEFKKLK